MVEGRVSDAGVLVGDNRSGNRWSNVVVVAVVVVVAAVRVK